MAKNKDETGVPGRKMTEHRVRLKRSATKQVGPYLDGTYKRAEETAEEFYYEVVTIKVEPHSGEWGARLGSMVLCSESLRGLRVMLDEQAEKMRALTFTDWLGRGYNGRWELWRISDQLIGFYEGANYNTKEPRWEHHRVYTTADIDPRTLEPKGDFGSQLSRMDDEKYATRVEYTPENLKPVIEARVVLDPLLAVTKKASQLDSAFRHSINEPPEGVDPIQHIRDVLEAYEAAGDDWLPPEGI